MQQGKADKAQDSEKHGQYMLATSYRSQEISVYFYELRPYNKLVANNLKY
ncbi:hypothetical protein VCRA2120E57_740012 [Vibrio crassostreae]|nr:hypothetical protein VCRA2120E57_740012 [Vibrio crassostreae]